MKAYKILDGIGSGCTASVITAIAAIGIASGIGIWNNLSRDSLEIDKRVTGVLQTAGVIVSVGLAGAVVSGILLDRLIEREQLISENQRIKQQLADERKDHRQQFIELNQDWEKTNFKLLKEMDKLRIADSEKDFIIKQLKVELLACHQRLEAGLLAADEFEAN